MKMLVFYCTLITIIDLPQIWMTSNSQTSSKTQFVDNMPYISNQCGRKIEMRCVTPASYLLGDSPIYLNETKSVYTVDLLGSQIQRYCVEDGSFHIATLGIKTVGAIIPVTGNSMEFLANYGSDIVRFKWDGYSPNVNDITVINTPDFQRPYPENFLDSGEISPGCNYFVNSVPVYQIAAQVETYQSSMHAYDGQKSKVVVSGLSFTNGLAWSNDAKWIYFSDSDSRKLFKAPYDQNTNSVGNRIEILDFTAHNIPGLPDASVVDAEDNLWLVSDRGFQILKVNPRNGEIFCKIIVPEFMATNLEFAPCNASQSSELNCMYLTTSLGIDIPSNIASSYPILKNVSPVLATEANVITTVSAKNGCLLQIKGTGAFGVPSRTAPSILAHRQVQ